MDIRKNKTSPTPVTSKTAARLSRGPLRVPDNGPAHCSVSRYNRAFSLFGPYIRGGFAGKPNSLKMAVNQGNREKQ